MIKLDVTSGLLYASATKTSKIWRKLKSKELKHNPRQILFSVGNMLFFNAIFKNIEWFSASLF